MRVKSLLYVFIASAGSLHAVDLQSQVADEEERLCTDIQIMDGEVITYTINETTPLGFKDSYNINLCQPKGVESVSLCPRTFYLVNLTFPVSG